MLPDLPPATSASQLTTYAICPRKFAFLYVYGVEPELRSTALVLGSALHSSIGWWFEQRLANMNPEISDAEEILAADLLAGAVCVPVEWKDATPASLEEEARRLLRLYLTKFGEMEVAHVEEPFEIALEHPETGEVFGRPLRGYFDLTLKDRRVIEIKSSARGWNASDLPRHLQVGAYAFAWNTMHGGPSQVTVHTIVKLKREPRVEVYDIERGEPDTLWWLTAAAELEAAIAARQFPPKPSPLCGSCEYAKACLAWRGAELDAGPRRPLPLHEEHGLGMSM